MKAVELLRTRVTYSEEAFAELVMWRLPKAAERSIHRYKYRLAYVVKGECVVRYDNEGGKGDHRHIAGRHRSYAFTTPEQLITDFERNIARWNRENRDS
jgi:hypothetical protein